MEKETVAVVGNGPSVTPALLEALICPSIGMNFVAGIFPHTRWRPDFYVFGCAPSDVPWPAFDKVQEVINLGIPCYIRSDWAGHFNGDNVYWFWARSNEDWATDFRVLYTCHTAVYLAAQLADLMGFKNVLFLGLDGVKPRDKVDPNHMIDDYFPYRSEMDPLLASRINAGYAESYTKMVGYMTNKGIACHFVVPPKKLGLEG